MQGACAQLAEPAENQLPSRVMFKPYLLADDTGFDAAFMDRLPIEHQGLRRRLTEASEGQQIQIQSLGQHTGMNMVDVPQGVNISDVLKALQDHPGVRCGTIACSFCSPRHATVPLPFLCLADLHKPLYASHSSAVIPSAPHLPCASSADAMHTCLPSQGRAHSV